MGGDFDKEEPPDNYYGVNIGAEWSTTANPPCSKCGPISTAATCRPNSKSIMVAWFSSNCPTMTKREELIILASFRPIRTSTRLIGRRPKEPADLVMSSQNRRLALSRRTPQNAFEQRPSSRGMPLYAAMKHKIKRCRPRKRRRYPSNRCLLKD